MFMGGLVLLVYKEFFNKNNSTSRHPWQITLMEKWADIMNRQFIKYLKITNKQDIIIHLSKQQR